MSDDLVVSGSELMMLLRQRYPSAYIRPLDADYNIPTEDAFNSYLKELGHRLFELYGDKWQTYFDCENFTLEALTLAYRKHWIARQANKGSAESVAIGAITIDSLGHALCFRLDPSKRIREFEPQNRQPVNLTSDQCASVSLVLLF
jgi:hypothetical protein